MRIALIALSAALIAQAGNAQAPARPAGPPPGASQDLAAAPTGAYTLDPRHSSVIARIGHSGGVSLSVFRFGAMSGTLDWNSAAPQSSKISVTVDMTSIESPVPNFATELAGDKFLKTGQFHDAKFVSTAIARTGATTGRITGNLTFMGVTKPVVIEAKLIGIGKARGAAVIGFSGQTRFKRSDFGFNTMVGPIGDEVELTIDAEFAKAA